MELDILAHSKNKERTLIDKYKGYAVGNGFSIMKCVHCTSFLGNVMQFS